VNRMDGVGELIFLCIALLLRWK